MQGDVDWDIWTLLVLLSAQPILLTSIQSTCSLLTKSFSGALAYYVPLLWRNQCSLTLRFHFKSEFLCHIITPRTVLSPTPTTSPALCLPHCPLWVFHFRWACLAVQQIWQQCSCLWDIMLFSCSGMFFDFLIVQELSSPWESFVLP